MTHVKNEIGDDTRDKASDVPRLSPEQVETVRTLMTPTVQVIAKRRRGGRRAA